MSIVCRVNSEEKEGCEQGEEGNGLVDGLLKWM